MPPPELRRIVGKQTTPLARLTPEERLKEFWVKTGRASAIVLVHYARTKGYNIPTSEAVRFIKAQTAGQVFRPPPPSNGHVTSPDIDAKWQLDLIDYSSKDAAKNNGFKYALVAVDVFSRRVMAAPMRSKTAADAAAALQQIKDVGGFWPSVVDTDVGAEFDGAFERLLRTNTIVHVVKDPRHKDALAVVDSAIARIKEAIGKELNETGSESWAAALPRAVEALNARRNYHLMGSSVDEFDRNPDLQYLMQKKAGEEILDNEQLVSKKLAALEAAGHYRTLLPKRDWLRKDQAKWSGTVFKVDRILNSRYVLSTDGHTHEIRFTLPVPAESESRSAPQGMQRGDAERDRDRREILRPFIEALKAHLGADLMTLKQAGLWLSKVPGYAEALERVKLRRFRDAAELFPDLQLEGEGHGTTVRVRA